MTSSVVFSPKQENVLFPMAMPRENQQILTVEKLQPKKIANFIAIIIKKCQLTIEWIISTPFSKSDLSNLGGMALIWIIMIYFVESQCWLKSTVAIHLQLFSINQAIKYNRALLHYLATSGLKLAAHAPALLYISVVKVKVKVWASYAIRSWGMQSWNESKCGTVKLKSIAM